MTRTIVVAAALLLGSASLVQAQGMNRGSGGSPGASQYSPGHEMQSGNAGDRDDHGPGASGMSPGHEMKEHGTVGQSRGDRDRDFDRDRDDRGKVNQPRGDRDFDRDRHGRGTVGQSRGDRDDFDRDRGNRDRDRGASGFSPGDRMHDRDIDRR